MYLQMFVYVYIHMYALQFSQKPLNYFFGKLTFFYLSDYDYEMALAAGIGG